MFCKAKILVMPILFAAPWIQPVFASERFPLSTDQRVQHFQRFRKAMLKAEHAAPENQDRSIKQWIWDRRPLYRANGAGHILELLDIFLRRNASSKQAEALDWLAERLTAEWRAVKTPLSADDKQRLRMYSDAALLFSVGPVSTHWVTSPRHSSPWTTMHTLVDQVMYRAWINPVLKDFIARVAADVGTSPGSEVASTRWFFQLYQSEPCARGLETPFAIAAD